MKTSSLRKSWNRVCSGLTAIAAFSIATSSQPANAAKFTVGGFSWDDANSVSTGKVVEGKIDECFSINSQVPNGFGAEKTLGKILAGDCAQSGDKYRAISLPDSFTGTSPLPNVDRTTIELGWGDRILRNLSGNDFVIYEAGSIGSSEGYSVSVRKFGESNFRPARYESYDSFEFFATNIGVFATAFDLDDFGLSADDAIDAIAISNLFNSQANSAGDKVDNSTGEGTILHPGDPSYSNGYAIVNKDDGKEYSTDKLDADIAYAIALHNTIAPPQQRRIPEPNFVLALLALGFVGVKKVLLK